MLRWTVGDKAYYAACFSQLLQQLTGAFKHFNIVLAPQVSGLHPFRFRKAQLYTELRKGKLKAAPSHVLHGFAVFL